MTSSAAPTPIRTIIVDDEPTARRGLRLLLARDPEVEIVGEAAGGDEAAEICAQVKPDLVFLDVQMPTGDGFAALARLGKNPPAVVFVTAYDEYAVRAFSVNAVDYLLKPYDDARFQVALNRAKGEVRRRQAEPIDAQLAQLLDYVKGGRAAAPTDDRILVKSGGEIIFLKPDEIDWVEAEGDYMKFHVGGRAHLARETMASVLARLDVRQFIRIHRSTIVNAGRVAKIGSALGGDYAVVLRDGTKLKLSRSYHDSLAALLQRPR
jgi:two-component system LytT family response regulator